MAEKLYLWDIKIDGIYSSEEPVHAVLDRISSNLRHLKYMFKVVGEYRLVAVIEVTSGRDAYFEHELSKLARENISDIKCTPLTAVGYPGRGPIKNIIYWNEMTINHERLPLSNLSNELDRARAQHTVFNDDVIVEFFKHKNCRKLTTFISADHAEDAEDAFQSLSIIQQYGHNIRNVCKEVQLLNKYLIATQRFQ
ncbi:uncharacterized protein [Argopecten irradians]|uniref:uncharacterized protein n=1 Tax=Argopecten irradians TaxID=31199 RepID=UPI00370F9818